MRNLQFDQEEYLPPEHCFPILIEYTDSGEQAYIDEPDEIDETRPFRILSKREHYETS